MTTIDHVGSCTGGNTIPLDDEGRCYHLGCKSGEVSNQVLICSCYKLAEQISLLFDKSQPVFKRESNRGYHTYTGIYNGKRVSIIAFGIGFAMVDFLIRELRRIIEGPLTFIQLGAAPAGKGVELGTAVISSDAVAYEIDFDNFTPDNSSPYRIFKNPVKADEKINELLENGLKKANIKFVKGRICSSPSYCAGICAGSVQSGAMGSFDFRTNGLLERVEKECGNITSFEMDSYILLWTSLRAVSNNPIRSSVVSIAGADLDGHVLSDEELNKKLLAVAPVILEQLGNLQA